MRGPVAGSREAAIESAYAWFDRGGFAEELSRRVAYRTESQRDGARSALDAYLEEEIGPSLARMGFTWRIVYNPSGAGPFLIAQRIEDAALWRPAGGALTGTPNKWVRSGDPRG